MQSCLTSGSLSKFSLLIIYCTLNALGFASKCPTLHRHRPTKPFHLLHRESLLVYVNLISSTLISFDEQLQNDRNSSPFTFGALRTAWDSISNKHLPGYPVTCTPYSHHHPYPSNEPSSESWDCSSYPNPPGHSNYLDYWDRSVERAANGSRPVHSTHSNQSVHHTHSNLPIYSKHS